MFCLPSPFHASTNRRARRTPSSHRSSRKSTRRSSVMQTVHKRESTPTTYQPSRSPQRGLIRLWKRINQPTRPRSSRRFSFMPQGFVTVEVSEVSTRQMRERSV